MEPQGKVENAGAVPDLNKPEPESQAVCQQCQTSPALFGYELFSTELLAKGSCCLLCFLELLRGLR